MTDAIKSLQKALDEGMYGASYTRYTRSPREGKGPFTLKPGEEKLQYDVGDIVVMQGAGPEQFMKIGEEWRISQHDHIRYRCWDYKIGSWCWAPLNDNNRPAGISIRRATEDEKRLLDVLDNVDEGKREDFPFNQGSLLPMEDLSAVLKSVKVDDTKLTLDYQLKMVTPITFLPITITLGDV